MAAGLKVQVWRDCEESFGCISGNSRRFVIYQGPKSASKRSFFQVCVLHESWMNSPRQGGTVASELLKTSNQYTARAVTRDKNSDKEKKLAEAGAKLVQADVNDLESLKRAVK